MADKWNFNSFLIVAGFVLTCSAQVAAGSWFLSGMHSEIIAQGITDVTQTADIKELRSNEDTISAKQILGDAQVISLQNLVHDRMQLGDATRTTTDLRIRAVDNSNMSVSSDVKNILAVQEEQGKVQKDMQSTLAELKTAVALLTAQRTR